MDKYKDYIEIQWWNELQKRDIDNWVKNFGVNKELAMMILENVIYYNDPQMKSYTRFLINRLKGHVYEQVVQQANYAFVDDGVLQSAWQEYKQKTRFIPAALKGDTTSSAFKVLRQWRSVLEGASGKNKDLFSRIADTEKDYGMGARRFILVDDFSGSGSQMLQVLKQEIAFQGQRIELGGLPDYAKDVEIVVAVYVAHTKAIREVGKKYPNVKIIYVDLVSDDLNYLSEKSIMYRKLDEKKAKAIVAHIQELCDTLIKGDTELQKLSSYVLNIPIVFEHGCPNNTLILLFAHTDSWQQLFKRGEEI